MKKKLFVSFSGGETSAMMTDLLLHSKWRSRYQDVVVLFANTGLENEETLEFVNECDQRLGFGTVWVEAVQHMGVRMAATARVVDYATACRNGEPFEGMVAKYGIPNVAYPHCTRSTKLTPMLSYIREHLGWKPKDFDVAIGIRADEGRRRSARQAEKNIVYPLLDWKPTTKVQVNRFWRDQPFRLRLCGYQGNCKTCWKKSRTKLMAIMEEDPSAFDFFARMEEDYARVGPEFAKPTIEPDYRRTFFRGGLSVIDLQKMLAEAGGADAVEDDANIYLDGCAEQCEITFPDTDDY